MENFSKNVLNYVHSIGNSMVKSEIQEYGDKSRHENSCLKSNVHFKLIILDRSSYLLEIAPSYQRMHTNSVFEIYDNKIERQDFGTHLEKP